MATPAVSAVQSPQLSLPDVFRRRPQPVVLGAGGDRRQRLLPNPNVFGDMRLPLPGAPSESVRALVTGTAIAQWALPGTPIANAINQAKDLNARLQTVTETPLTEAEQQQIQALTAHLILHSNPAEKKALLPHIMPMVSSLITIQEALATTPEGPPFGSLVLARLAAGISYSYLTEPGILDGANPGKIQPLTLLLGAYARQVFPQYDPNAELSDPQQQAYDTVATMRLGHLIDLSMVDPDDTRWFAPSDIEELDLSGWNQTAIANQWWLNVTIENAVQSRQEAKSRLDVLRRLYELGTTADEAVSSDKTDGLVQDLARLDESARMDDHLGKQVLDTARGHIVRRVSERLGSTDARNARLRDQMGTAIRRLIGADTALSADEQALFRHNAHYLLFSPGKQYAAFVTEESDSPVFVKEEGGVLVVNVYQREDGAVAPFLRELKRLSMVMDRPLFPVNVIFHEDDSASESGSVSGNVHELAAALRFFTDDEGATPASSSGPPAYRSGTIPANVTRGMLAANSGLAAVFLHSLWSGPSAAEANSEPPPSYGRRSSIIEQQVLRERRTGENMPDQITGRIRASRAELGRYEPPGYMGEQDVAVDQMDQLEWHVHDTAQWLQENMQRVTSVNGHLPPDSQLNTFIGIMSAIQHLGQLRLAQFRILDANGGDPNGEFLKAAQHMEKLVGKASDIKTKLSDEHHFGDTRDHSLAHHLKLEGLMRALSMSPSLSAYFLSPSRVLLGIHAEIIHPFYDSFSYRDSELGTPDRPLPLPGYGEPTTETFRADAVERFANAMPPSGETGLPPQPPTLDSVLLEQRLAQLQDLITSLLSDSGIEFELQRHQEKVRLLQALGELYSEDNLTGRLEEAQEKELLQVVNALIPDGAEGGDMAVNNVDMELLRAAYYYYLDKDEGALPEKLRNWALRFSVVSQVFSDEAGGEVKDALRDRLRLVILDTGLEASPLNGLERLALLQFIEAVEFGDEPDDALLKWQDRLLMTQLWHLPRRIEEDELHPVLFNRLRHVVSTTFSTASADAHLGEASPVNELMLFRAQATVNHADNPLGLSVTQRESYNAWYGEFVLARELTCRLGSVTAQDELRDLIALPNVERLMNSREQNCMALLAIRCRLRERGGDLEGVDLSGFLDGHDQDVAHLARIAAEYGSQNAYFAGDPRLYDPAETTPTFGVFDGSMPGSKMPNPEELELPEALNFATYLERA